MERRQRVERITDMIRRAAGSGFTGKLVLNFRGGTPTSVKRESHHGPEDDWSFADGSGEVVLRAVESGED